MNQLKKLFVANLKTTFREKQVWFWSIFYPVLLLVVFLTIFGGFGSGEDTDFKASIAVVEEQETTLPEVKTALQNIPVLEWHDENTVNREQAEQWIKDKEIDAAIVLPTGDGEEQTIEMIFNTEKENSTTSQALNGILNGVVQRINYQQAGFVPQIKITSQFISSGSEDLKYTDFLLTGLIALSIAQAGMFGLVELVEMRRNGMLKRLKMTPVSMRIYSLSSILVRFILSAIQVALLTLIGLFFYGANLNFGIFSFILMFTVGTISFSAIGFLVASLSKSMESFFGITNLVSFIMMFLSGIFFEYSMLPDFLKPVANALPLTYFANGIRDSMVYGLGIMNSAFWTNLGILAAWGLAAFLIGSKLYSWKADSR